MFLTLLTNLQYSKHTDQKSVKRSVSHAAQQIPGADRRKNPDAAAALFAEKGYAHTTLQDIIDATGLSKGAVYHHFQSKEEIAARVWNRLGTQVTGELARIRDDASLTGLQKLQAVFAVCLVPQRQQTLQRALPRLWDDPQFYPSSCTIAGKDHPPVSGADGPAGNSRRQHSHAGP